MGAGASAFQSLNNALTMMLTDSQYYGRVQALMGLSWSLFGIISLFEAENLGRLVYVDADMEERRLQLVVDFAQHTLRGLRSPPD